MQQLTALRPLVTAGAAAVGASLIALTPAVSNDVAADLQHSAVSIEVQLADTVVNPIQTWVDFFQDAATNLQGLYQQWATVPFPILQQVAANMVTYADLYVTTFQGAAQTATTYFTSTEPGYFFPVMEQAIAALMVPDFPLAFEYLNFALWFEPLFTIFEPLENTLQIGTGVTQNIANAYAYFAHPITGGLATVSTPLVLGPGDWLQSIGYAMQDTYNAFASGDPLGGLTDLVNLPGVTAQAIINGVGYGPQPDGYGFLTPKANFAAGGVFSEAIIAAQKTAGSIALPNAINDVPVNPTNIVEGGSLAAAVQAFLAQATSFSPTGWPAPNVVVNSLINVLQTYFGQGSFFSGAAAAGAVPAEFAGLAPSIAADIGSLAPSLAADVSGTAPSLATNLAGTLAPELGTLAAHLLTSLF
ncbi:hypothetical protein H7H82_03095 [Mycobacterium heidelbergense]|uniref:Uncharacterized protein n=1 Tax=Mycobacterium heidelbergense TaxID=53376 RepID=A0A1X0DDS4_MYCHE|nr:hypothetical protein [Mycobacterium heidelbergense]MCV7049600.1 hypothetical protein [Mycobacterium heidelbergense]ORA70342.1 hypothetical protein BST25_19555 [Mycobacterium heidelbergense]BBZ52734.1 hypothetical protein MHEI_44510 [Mycobacterium heidelbergense]